MKDVLIRTGLVVIGFIIAILFELFLISHI